MIIAWSKAGCESAHWTRSDGVGKVISDTQARSKAAFLSRRQAFHVARSGSLSTSRKVCCGPGLAQARITPSASLGGSIKVS